MLFTILFIISIFLFLILCYQKSYQREYFDINTYKEIIKNNDKKNIYKIGLNKDISIYKTDCYDKCSKTDCIKLDNMTKVLEKCMKCNSQKKKCFNHSIIGGTCDDCNIENENEKLNCLHIQNYGCTNPNNIFDNNGVEPYYIQIPDNNLNSPYDKKCVFCWNLLDNI